MNRHAVAAALVAGLVLLAGCSSGLTGTPDGTATEESALDGETTPEEIKQYCLDSLAEYKHPREVEFVEELPRTTTGKVQKFELRGEDAS